MEEGFTLLLISLVVLFYGYQSKLLNRFNISGPMVFTIVGVLLSPLFFGNSYLHVEAESVQIVAQIALIVVLFSDAATLNLKNLEWKIPFRLLFIGLPLTIIFSLVVAVLMFPSVSLEYLFLMALILAPTDAALGKAVVTDKRVPLHVSSSINVESGLNDGIVFPLVITAVALINGTTNSESGNWVSYLFSQILLGALFGALSGFIGAKLSNRAINKNMMDESYHNLIPIALAVFSYYLAEHFGGNGFISAFFAGLFMGNFSEDAREHIENFAESEGELLVLVSFLVFGLVFIPFSIEYWSLKTFMYALFSLTIFRMLPVYLSLSGLRLDNFTKLFIGWFGPRGIASILYVLIVIHKLGGTKGYEEVYAVISLTILLSIFAHGFSANPLVKLYGKG